VKFSAKEMQMKSGDGARHLNVRHSDWFCIAGRTPCQVRMCRTNLMCAHIWGQCYKKKLKPVQTTDFMWLCLTERNPLAWSSFFHLINYFETTLGFRGYLEGGGHFWTVVRWPSWGNWTAKVNHFLDIHFSPLLFTKYQYFWM